MTNPQTRFEDIYATGKIPWDAIDPPPEVMTIVDDLPPGKALDLGCGYGRSSIYLAQHGWQVDGIDFVPSAIAEAKKRAAAMHVSEQINFQAASVGKLDFLDGEYDVAFDVGCLHALPRDEMFQYRDGLLRLLRSGATYLLFIRLSEDDKKNDEQASDGPPHVPDSLIDTLFGEGFVQEQAVYGTTGGSSESAWRSAWFRFRRK